jgi:hypothetical protein
MSEPGKATTGGRQAGKRGKKGVEKRNKVSIYG